jgi:hypothetical protein
MKIQLLGFWLPKAVLLFFFILAAGAGFLLLKVEFS